MMLCSLVVWLWILLYLSPDSSRVHSYVVIIKSSEIHLQFSYCIVHLSSSLDVTSCSHTMNTDKVAG